jgi:hypothetical protein
MESLTLEQIYFMSEIIGVFAVVVSLVYVGLQVKQNTQSIRLNTVHNIAEGQREVNSMMATNSELSAIVHKGLQDIESISGIDKFQFYTWAYATLRPLEDAYFQYLEGAFEDNHWQALSRQFINLIKLPGLLAYWEDRKFVYSDAFQQFMDDELIPSPLTDNFKLAGT